MQYFISFRPDATSRPPHTLPLAQSSRPLVQPAQGDVQLPPVEPGLFFREQIQQLKFFLSGVCSCFFLIQRSCMFKPSWRGAGHPNKVRWCHRDSDPEERCWREWRSFGTPRISNIFLSPFPVSFLDPPQTNTIFFCPPGTNMEFRDEPVTLLDISFLLNVGWNRVSVSRDNSPKEGGKSVFYNLLWEFEKARP